MVGLVPQIIHFGCGHSVHTLFSQHPPLLNVIQSHEQLLTVVDPFVDQVDSATCKKNYRKSAFGQNL